MTIIQTTNPRSADAPDTRDMEVVHRALRREVRLLPDLVRRTEAGDTARAALVAEWVLDIVEFLNHHHTGEDELVWPKLLDRARIDRELIDLMADQHALVESLLEPIGPLTARWREAPTTANREVLVRALEPIAEPLIDHLEREEREVLALIGRHLSSSEWAEVGHRASAAIPASTPT